MNMDATNQFRCIKCLASFYGTLVNGDSVCNRCRMKELTEVTEELGGYEKEQQVTDKGAQVTLKVGDRVKCVEEDWERRIANDITLGQTYTVLGTDWEGTRGAGHTYVQIKRDDGNEGWVYTSRFVLADATPAPVPAVTDSTRTGFGGITGFSTAGFTSTPNASGGVTISGPLPISGGVKYNQGKLQFRLILPEFEAAMAGVLTKGAEKYPEADNWKRNPRWMYEDALMRHLNAMRRGEVMDDGPGGTGQPHTACVAVNSMFLYWFDQQAELANLHKKLEAPIF